LKNIQVSENYGICKGDKECAYCLLLYVYFVLRNNIGFEISNYCYTCFIIVYRYATDNLTELFRKVIIYL
jgi:hypothetical protein